MSTDTGHLPFVLVKPQTLPPRHEHYTILSSPPEIENISWIWEDRDPADVLALDIETKGNDVSSADSYVVGVGLSDSRGAIYIPVTPELWKEILDALYTFNVPLLAHNVCFDGAYCYRDNNCRHLRWHLCTYGAYRQVANEGFKGQRWGLKSAQVELLGWEAKGDVELDQWLVDNGHVNQSKRPRKELMYLAPPEILGKYCAMDADSTYLLGTKILSPILEKFKALDEYHRIYWLNLVKILIEQQLSGILVDREQLLTYHAGLSGRAKEAAHAFLTHPDVRPHVEGFNARAFAEFNSSRPRRFKKQSSRPAEPPKYRKDGKLSVNWVKWDQAGPLYQFALEEPEHHTGLSTEEMIQARCWSEPEETSHYTNWAEKLERLAAALDDGSWMTDSDVIKRFGLFNMNSSAHKSWLFYECLKFPVLVWTDNETEPQPAVDSDALKGFGEPGKLLTTYNELVKEESYVSACLENLRVGEDQTRGVLNPRFKAPGTLTGRLAGDAGFNIQQQPKTPGYLKCWIPRPGKVWVDMDWTALEPTVLSESSRDKGMLDVYGPTAKGNDIYLYVGAHIKGKISETIRSFGYDPYNPTKEAISAAKKGAKQLRQVCKVVYLSSGYGAGPAKIRASLALEGIDLSLEEVKKIHSDYWALFSGIKKYERFLVTQWEKNNGWFLNPLGLPTCVAQDYIKDIVNRSIQSSGHSIHVIGCTLFRDMMAEAGIAWSPIIMDWHDQFIVEVDETEAERVVSILKSSYIDKINAMLGGHVRLKSDPQIVKNLAEAKCEM